MSVAHQFQPTDALDGNRRVESLLTGNRKEVPSTRITKASATVTGRGILRQTQKKRYFLLACRSRPCLSGAVKIASYPHQTTVISHPPFANNNICRRNLNDSNLG